MTPRTKANAKFVATFITLELLTIVAMALAWDTKAKGLPLLLFFIIAVIAIVLWPTLQEANDKEERKAIQHKAAKHRARR